jgi:hypothetical protein
VAKQFGSDRTSRFTIPILARPARLVATTRLVEPLESRQLFAVSLDAAGYTVVTPSRDDRVVYVSSSTGSDDNDGSSPSSAVRSLGRGASLLRDDHGDQLLLKRGDTWHGAVPAWNKGGASAERPMVLGAYGTGDRPTVATDGATALSVAGLPVSHLVVQGVRFAATARDPNSPDFDPAAAGRMNTGLDFSAPGSDLLLEDCLVADFGTNVVFYRDTGNRLANVRVRRNVIVDAYSTTERHSQGLFATGVDGLTLDGNVFDHNGWNEQVAGAGATMFNHDVYLTSNTTGVVVTGNVFANAGSHGLQARSGGDILDNLFVANPLHLSYGLVNGDGSPTAGGVSGTVNGNVFLGTRDIAGAGRGVGVEIANVKAAGPTFLSNNVFSNVEGNGVAWQAGGFAAISLTVGSGKDDASLAVGLRDLTVQGNVVYRWFRGLSLQGDMRPDASGTDGYSGLVVKQNAFSQIAATAVVDHPAAFNGQAERWAGNSYDAGTSERRLLRVAGRSLTVDDWSDNAAGDVDDAPAYAAPNRSLATYAGGSAAAFFAAVRSMSAAGTATAASGSTTAAASPLYTAAGAIDYVRAGFQDSADATPRNWAPPSGPTATAALPAAVATDQSSLTFTVTYRDGEGLDLTTLDAGDVYLVGRGGAHLPATLLGVTPGDDDGKSATATYQVASPKAVWRKSDAGGYKVVAVDGQVKDTDGFALEGGTLLAGTVTVTVVPPPPTVKKVKFAKGKKGNPDTLTVTFDRDLAAVPPATSLWVGRLPDAAAIAADPALAADPAAAATPLDLSTATVTYDPLKRRATWTFAQPPAVDPATGLPVGFAGQLTTGSYQVRVVAAGVASAEDGKPLDGNADGLGGDDYVWAKTLKVKR